ncbi:MAG: hypothetical protein ACOCRZ_06555 [Halothermotrichaceae bacterium]
MKKYLLSLFALLAIIFTLVSCSQNQSQPFEPMELFFRQLKLSTAV